MPYDFSCIWNLNKMNKQNRLMNTEDTLMVVRWERMGERGLRYTNWQLQNRGM